MTHTTTPLICSECGEGNYAPDGFDPAEQNGRLYTDDTFACVSCGHTVALSDLVLDEGESVSSFMGTLYVVTPS